MNRRGLFFFAALLLVTAVLSAEQDSSTLALVQTIPLSGVHGVIAHLCADVYHGRVFIAAEGNDSVEVLNARTNTLLNHIGAITEPHSVMYLKSSNRLFVTSGGDGSLHIFDATTLKPISAVHLGRDPGSIRVDSIHRRVYVGYAESALAVFDATGKHLADIALKGDPESFQIAEQKRKIFVNVPDTHSVAVVDAANSKVMADWPVKEGAENYALALDEANKRIFVACGRPARLLVLDMDSGVVLAQLPTVGSAGDVFYDPIHARVYVIGGQGQIAVYAQETPDRYSNIDAIATSAGAQTGLFVPEWDLLFVALREFAGHPAEIRIYKPR